MVDTVASVAYSTAEVDNSDCTPQNNTVVTSNLDYMEIGFPRILCLSNGKKSWIEEAKYSGLLMV